MSVGFSVMTYNVHSCVGRDGKASPERIAAVIAEIDPDIVALQELDFRLTRSGLADQAEMIAACLNMCCHFHPSIELEEGLYGNAILSKHPLSLVRTGELPTLPGRPDIEKRGALQVEMDLAGRKVCVINSHLGLNRRERLAQSELLLGPEWIGNPACTSPLIFCADLNALPVSRVYRRFRERLRDVQDAAGQAGPRRTYPSLLPLARIDHIFVSAEVAIEGVIVPWTPLTRRASDHLPLVARVRIP
jgi:endonuclease/exonuclease/phosphatase family metal-dependent hydrolase